MVFVKFHNMNRKKISNVAFKLKQPQNLSLYKSKQYYNYSSQMTVFFSSFFNLCTVYFTKNACSFFLSFFLLYAMFNNVQLLSFCFLCPFFHCPVAFCFGFTFFFPFFHNKLLIQCPFFSNLISTSLCPYLNTITIGTLPSLFNFSL